MLLSGLARLKTEEKQVGAGGLVHDEPGALRYGLVADEEIGAAKEVTIVRPEDEPAGVIGIELFSDGERAHIVQSVDVGEER